MKKIIFNSGKNLRLIWRFLLFIVGIFIINIPLQIGLDSLMNKSLIRGYISGSIFVFSVIASLFFQIRFLDKSSFKKYGLKLDGVWVQEFVIGCLVAAIQLFIFFALMYFTGNVQIVDFMVTGSADYTFTGGLFSELFQQMVASITEEIFFRAFLFYIVFEALCRFGKSPLTSALFAWIVTAPFFGIGHISNEGATILSTINLGIDGLMMCLPFLITGKLGMSIGMHFSWNVMQGAVLGFANSGYHAKVSVLSSNLVDNLLTGGQFGPEGSILLILLDIIAVLLIISWKKIKKYDHWVHPDILGNGSLISA